jgi:PRTRC genetic system protein E
MNNLFTSLSQLISEGVSVNISVTKQADGLIVSVLAKAKNVEDPAAKKVQPLVLKGTAEELDAEFLNLISNPITTSSDLLVNMKSYQDSVATAEANSKKQKDEENKNKKAIEANDKKFNKNLEKFNEFIKEKNIENAEKYLITNRGITPVSSKSVKSLAEMEESYKAIAPKQISLLDQIDETPAQPTPEPTPTTPPVAPDAPSIEQSSAQSLINEERIEAIQDEHDQRHNVAMQEMKDAEIQSELTYVPPTIT